MDSSRQLIHELDALRRDFAQYRVETALRLDKLERRVDRAEDALDRAGIRPVRVMQHASTTTRSYSYDSTTTALGENRHRLQGPTSIKTAPRPAPHSHALKLGHGSAAFEYPEQPSRSDIAASRALGSRDNAQYLPFAIEKIAWMSQRKAEGDRRTCLCGRPTFDIKCFISHHFNWCLVHQRPIIQGQRSCSSKDNHNCKPITWEKHDEWEVLVRKSFDSGFLGTKKVEDLYQALFPIEIYPEKYQGGWYVG